MHVEFPLTTYPQAIRPDDHLGKYAKAAYLLAARAGEGEPDFQAIHDEIVSGDGLPELAEMVPVDEVASIPAAELAAILRGMDQLDPSEDMTFTAYSGAQGGTQQPVSQLDSIPDFLGALEDHGLPGVEVPLVPLLEAAKSVAPEGRVTDESLVRVLAGYYCSFDPRFQAIFYPAPWAKMTLLSAAAYEDLSSALAARLRLSEEEAPQDVDWCWRSLCELGIASPVASMLYRSGDASSPQEFFDPFVDGSSETAPPQGDKLVAGLAQMGMLPGKAPAPAEMLGEEPIVPLAESADGSRDHAASGLGHVLRTADVVAYPRLDSLGRMRPAPSLRIAVMEAVSSGMGSPATTIAMASTLLDYMELGTEGDEEKAKVSQLSETLLLAMEQRRRQTIMAGGHALQSIVLVKDVRLQYVLVCLMAQDEDPETAELPPSIKQLKALLDGFKPATLIPAMRKDLDLDEDIVLSDEIVAHVMSILTKQNLGRETRSYGRLSMDMVRMTLSSMAASLVPIKMRPDKFKMTANGMFSMLMEVPSAFSDVYGTLNSRKAFELMLASGTGNPTAATPTHPSWAIVNYSGFPVNYTNPYDTPQSMSQELCSAIVSAIRSSVSKAPDIEWNWYDDLFSKEGTITNKAVLDLEKAAEKMGIEFPALDGSEHAAHLMTAVLGKMLLRDSGPKLLLRRLRQYVVKPVVFRVADSLIRYLSLGEMPCSSTSEGSLVRAHAFLLALMVVSSEAVLSESPDVISDAGDIVDAAYPQAWDFVPMGIGSANRERRADRSGRRDRTARRGQREGKTSDSTAQRQEDQGRRGTATLEELLGIDVRSSDQPGSGRGTRRRHLGPLLSRLGIDMVTSAQDGNFGTIVERDTELQQVVSILLRREKANVMILGEAGTGKTALVELLAKSIADEELPEKLLTKNLIRLDAIVLAGIGEDKLKEICDEAKRCGAILFIDEIHSLSLQMLNVMKPYLARADLSVIGATTNKEYQATILKDKALARRFSTIRLAELTQEQTVACLKTRVPEYEHWFSVTYGDQVPYTTARAAATYVTNRHSPDRELDILDTAGSLAMMGEKDTVGDEEIYEAVRILTANRSVLSTNDVIKSLQSDAGELEARSEEAFGDVVGQDSAKSTLVQQLAMSQIGLHSNGSPRNVLMFAGPSGVGKTMTAERIPKFLGINDDAVLSLNMSEFVRGHEYSRLVGSPTGYIGYEQGGILTNFGMAHPDGVVIFDEIEKAARKVRQMLLNLFDKGYIDSAAGEHVDCRSMTFVCTSNEGFAEPSGSIGFIPTSDNRSYQQRVAECRSILVKRLSPAFVGRFDEIIVFGNLTSDDIRQSCRIEYQKMAKAYKANAGIDISELYPEENLERLLEETSETEIEATGARSIMRRVEREITKAFVFGKQED